MSYESFAESVKICHLMDLPVSEDFPQQHHWDGREVDRVDSRLAGRFGEV